jgi:hypothetical protein
MDRLTHLNGRLVAEFPDEETARKMARRLEREGTSYRWERWGGPRTGWNSVAQWEPVAGFVGPDARTAVLS